MWRDAQRLMIVVIGMVACFSAQTAAWAQKSSAGGPPSIRHRVYEVFETGPRLVYWERTRDGRLEIYGRDPEQKALVRDISEHGAKYLPVIEELTFEALEDRDVAALGTYIDILGDVVDSIPARIILARLYLRINQVLQVLPTEIDCWILTKPQELTLDNSGRSECRRKWGTHIGLWKRFLGIEGDCLQFLGSMRSKAVLAAAIKTLRDPVPMVEEIPTEWPDRPTVEFYEHLQTSVRRGCRGRLYAVLNYLGDAYRGELAVAQEIRRIHQMPGSALAVLLPPTPPMTPDGYKYDQTLPETLKKIEDGSMVSVVTRAVCAQAPPLKSMENVDDLDVKDLSEFIAETWLVPEDKNEQLVGLYTRIIERLQEFPKTDRLIKYAYVGRGIRREGLGDIKGAIRDFTKAIEIDPLFSGALVGRALARMKLGDTKGALRDARAGAEARRKRGDPVLRDSNDALAKDPASSRVLSNRAFDKSHTGDYEGAIRDYKRALLEVSEPDDTCFLMWSLFVAQLQIGDYQSAIATASLAIELFPDRSDSETWYRKRAELRASAGDLSGARADLQEFSRRVRREKLAEIQELTESLNQNPNVAHLLLSRAQLWRYLGEYDKALSDVEKALPVASDSNLKLMARQLEIRISVEKERHHSCDYVQEKKRWDYDITRRYREHHDRDEGQEKTP